MDLGRNPEPGTYGITALYDSDRKPMGRQYAMFLIHNANYLTSGEYRTLEVNATKGLGEYLEFEIEIRDDSIGFINHGTLRVFSIASHPYPLVMVNATINITKDIADAEAVWVESGWWRQAGGYKQIAFKRVDGEIITQSLVRHTDHYFKYSDFQSIGEGGWIIAFDGRSGLNRGMILGKVRHLGDEEWSELTKAYVVSWVDKQQFPLLAIFRFSL